MWYMEMNYKKNCTLGLNFKNRIEMYEWISRYFKDYTFKDEFKKLKIYYKKEEEE